jgi:DNA-binding SARP family transcriptional activator
MRFTVLGPLRAWNDDRELNLGPPKQRAVLALLLAQAGRIVPMYELVDALWDGDPPANARNVVHRHVGVLRRLLEPELGSRADARRLVRSGSGYRLVIQTDELDLLRFRSMRERARELAAIASTREAALPLLLEALALWDGPCATCLPAPKRDHPVFAAVNGEYVAAAKDAASLALTVGGSEQVLPVLREACDVEPYDEGLQALLMLLLSATGRQAEALEHFTAVRSRLAEDLGLDPGPALRDAQQQVLRRSDTDRSDGIGAGAGSGAKPEAAWTRPEQLPRDLESFAGRQAELERLQAELQAGSDAAGGTIVISAIGGAPGIGKTALAIHWAHRVAPRFPDGQLYIDLRGFDPSGAVLPPHEAMRGFLNALGVPPERVPAELDAQVGLYRSLLAHRRVLVVLDNARDAEQVRPLLPSSAGCMTIITSRSQLVGLVAAEGAQAVRLDVLTGRESSELMARRLGEQRVHAEPEAARRLAELCGHLPLALAVICARAVVYPDASLASFVEELRASRGRLDAFETGDPATDTRTVFSLSYRTLSPGAARMFRLLSLSPAPEVSLAATTALADTTRQAAKSALGELTRSQLWREPTPGRFSAHDLIRTYGRELAFAEDSETERSLARRRLFDHYMYSAHAAESRLVAQRERITLPPSPEAAAPMRFDEPDQATAWLNTELTALLAIVETTSDSAEHAGHSWRIAAILERCLDRLARWQELVYVERQGLAAAELLDDPSGQAWCHRALGFALGRLELYAEAELHFHQARDLDAAIGDLPGQARTCRYMAYYANVRKEHDEALRHYERAAQLYGRAGRLSGSAATANDVGWTRILLGDYEQALVDCAWAVRVAKEVGDQNVEAAAWDSVGVAHHHLGHRSEALDAYSHALALYRELGDDYLIADTLTHIGDAHLTVDATSEAHTAWREALTILEGLGHPEAEDVRSRLLSRPTGQEQPENG